MNYVQLDSFRQIDTPVLFNYSHTGGYHLVGITGVSAIIGAFLV